MPLWKIWALAQLQESASSRDSLPQEYSRSVTTGILLSVVVSFTNENRLSALFGDYVYQVCCAIICRQSYEPPHSINLFQSAILTLMTQQLPANCWDTLILILQAIT
jgi:hypothetical protein